MNDSTKQFKMPSTLGTLVGVLVFISGISGLLLGLTYGLTKDAIANVEIEKTKTAFTKVLPGFDNDPLKEEIKGNVEPGIRIYPLTAKGKPLGYAIETFSQKGYSGYIGAMVGIDKDGILRGIQILKASETPGLGSNIASPSFTNQFLGKSTEKNLLVKKDGGEVDAISAATISSRAICDAINKSFTAYKGVAR